VTRHVQTKRKESNQRARRWLSVVCAAIISVLLVTIGAQLANGPDTNTSAVAYGRNPTVTKPATSPSGTGSAPATTVATVNATPSSSQVTVGNLTSTVEPQPTPISTQSATPTATVAPTVGQPSATPPSAPSIVEGTSALATTAFQVFIERNRAELNFGHSTSPMFTVVDTGVVGQYFSNAILEYHPELADTPYAVELTRVGVALAGARDLLQSTAFLPLASDTQGDSNCWFVAATQHRLCAGFRTYWRSQGLDLGDPGTSYRESLALLGYPISEEFTDPTSGRTVQYFERGILEYDPAQVPANRVIDVSPTDAVLTRWHYQIVASVNHLPSGG